jgi:L-idonate 5-dehydrogenase
MLAVVCHGKEDLRVEEYPLVPLKNNEVRVQVSYGGICGSDLHYFSRGGVGDFMIREPMVLGHEISGVVLETGTDVKEIKSGMKAGLNPSKPCLKCNFCLNGQSNLCTNMFFLGSAGRFPHVQGGFSQELILRADQVIPVPEATSLLELSLAEPLSVGLHAVARAGSLLNKRVLVSGSGPIGLLTALSALHAGATEVIATDIHDYPLQIAKEKIGVQSVINVAKQAEALQEFISPEGYFDVILEASGSPSALPILFQCIKRGGRIVQIGMLPPGTTSIPVNLLQTREIKFIGAFRAHNEFALAVKLIVSKRMDASAILSGTYALSDARSAFLQAGNRQKVIKLHLNLSDIS